MKGLGRMGIVACLFVLQAACAKQPQHSDVGALVTEVRRDEVAAAASFRDRVIALSGRVREKGMKSGKAAETEWAPGFARARTTQVTKNYGYLVLESTAAPDAKSVCLFDDEMLDVLAPVAEGQVVKLRCFFSMIVGKKGSRAPVFYGCNVDT